MKYLPLALLFLLVSCKKENAPKQIGDAYGQYIFGHSTGSISADDDVYIQLAQPIDSKKIGEKLSSGIISISPNIDHEAYYQDERTVIVRPTERWAHDKSYNFEVALTKIFSDVDEKNSTPKFSLHVLPIKLNMDTYKPTYNGNKVSLSGKITSSEKVESAVVEKMVTAKQNGKSLDITWNHYSDKNHAFEIENLERSTKKSKVILTWNGKSIDKSFASSRGFDILPQGVFQVIEAKVRADGSKAIDIKFSDKVASSQNLKGLITINGNNGSYKYDISDNTISVYPPKSTKGSFVLFVDESVSRSGSGTLAKDYELPLSFDPTPPKLKLAGKGVIVPNSGEVIFPFYAQNLKGVNVEVFKIFQDNVLQFLQYSKLNEQYRLDPVGRIIHQEHVDLSRLNSDDNSESFVRYALDLSKITSIDPGAIYQIRLGFSMSDVNTYPCEEETRVASQTLASRDGFTSIMRDSYGSGYNWNDRDNPCKPSYYRSNNFISRNVLASNLGIISKYDENDNVLTTVTDLRNVSTLSGVSLKYYDFQQQLISSSSTNGAGLSEVQLEKKPSFLIARHQGEFGYLSMQDNNANSLSEYEVSGKKKSDGVDGFIYGERGVWRPGDTLFLNFVLEDKNHKLPSQHPVSIFVDDARGKSRYKKTTTHHTGGIYHFPVPTTSDAVTGNWRATIKVGGKTFRKTIKVETVKPNRIKVDYDKEKLNLYNDNSLTINGTWLHGAPASKLRTTIDFSLTAVNTSFKNYKSYNFDDPARTIRAYPFQILDGSLDENGKKSVTIQKNKAWLPPGKLKARLESKVFEKGGNFSTDTYTLPGDMYQNYVGVKVPTNRWGSNYIDQKNPQPIQVVLVDKDGNPLRNKTLKVGLYNARWNWWYDRGYGDKYKYNTSTHLGAKDKKTITTDANGKATYSPSLSGYGNYMVRVCDEESGHCTGQMFYTGRYSRGSDNQEGPSQLIFKTDKKSYSVGEEIKVNIPSTKDSKIFVSIENGSNVLKAFWIEGKSEITTLNLPTDGSMNSNIYIHAHLIQAHNNGENDLPMRMYGVVPVSVIDGQSTLEPTIGLAEVIKPNEPYTLTVGEANNKAMYYTVAVVDEGLLSLTRHKTPDPWNHFYGKQALGVKTWDVYDYVLDGYGGALDQYISIGGDAMNLGKDNAQKVNRFEPVVTHLGPFYLAAGQKAKHTLTMPNYVGAVRAMVVARESDTYGSSEKTALVKKALMVQSSLPRVLGPGESLSLPANIWAMEDNVKNVSVSVETSDNVSISGASSSELAFSKIGDKLAHFKATIGQETGVATIKTKAQSGSESAYEETNIEIRNPNPYTSEVELKTLKPGETWSGNYKVFGSQGSNEGILEVSNLPAVNFGKRLQYLIRYPYGCVEQTTSSVFPQLYLAELTDLDTKQILDTEQNINAAISKLILFQQPSGGFSYWSGGRTVSDWGTNYAGHFLLEAKDKGYSVPSQVIKDFVKYQTQVSNNSNLQDLDQAYRLFILAKAGDPNVGAMNRLRKSNKLDQTASYLLGAAYALIGQKDAATQLIRGVSRDIKVYNETGNTYGSNVRDMAVIAMALHKMGDQDGAIGMISSLSKFLSTDRWYSTQTTAWGLLALGQIYSKFEKDDLKFSYALGGSSDAVQTPKSIYQKNIDVVTNPTGTYSITNNSNTVQFAKMILSGQRPPGDNPASSQKHISLSIKYTDITGNILDPKAIPQGTDFFAIATVKNPGTKGYQIDEVALSQIFPSGWEIQNDRVTGGQSATTGVEYQNVRDDRVYTFFDIGHKAKKEIKTRLTATFAGRFYMPPTVVEAMYDNEIQANTEGYWVEVVK